MPGGSTGGTSIQIHNTAIKECGSSYGYTIILLLCMLTSAYYTHSKVTNPNPEDKRVLGATSAS